MFSPVINTLKFIYMYEDGASLEDLELCLTNDLIIKYE